MKLYRIEVVSYYLDEYVFADSFSNAVKKLLKKSIGGAKIGEEQIREVECLGDVIV